MPGRASCRRRSMTRDHGSVTVYVLLVMLGLLTTLGVLTGAYLRRTTPAIRYVERRHARTRLTAALAPVAQELARNLSADPPHTRDLAAYRVARSAASVADPVAVELIDHSGRFNPAFVRVGFLEQSRLWSWAGDPRMSAAELDELRAAPDAWVRLERLETRLAEEPYARVFSRYALPSVRTISEVALERMVVQRTGDESAAAAVRGRFAAPVEADAAHLSELLGTAVDSIYPLLRHTPTLNVNVTDPDLLRSVLGYRPLGVQNVAAATNAILAQADAGLTRARLRDLIEADEDARIWAYLGDSSSAFTARATADGWELRWHLLWVTPNAGVDPELVLVRDHLVQVDGDDR